MAKKRKIWVLDFSEELQAFTDKYKLGKELERITGHAANEFELKQNGYDNRWKVRLKQNPKYFDHIFIIETDLQ